MLKLITISTVTLATVTVLATATICSFCSCAHSTPKTNADTTIQVGQASIENSINSFYKPFGLDLTEDSQRAYMINVDVYDEEGNIEKSYEPIIKDPTTFCEE